MKRFILCLLFTINLLAVFAYDVKVKNVFFNLDHDNMTASVTYGKDDYIQYRRDYSKKVIIPDTINVEGKQYIVNAIGDYAFYGCREVHNVIMPTTIASIGNFAFTGCYLIENIDLPIMLKTIGNSAFAYCEALSSIILPNEVISIGNDAFSGCYLLNTVFISSSVNSIGFDAFAGCGSLETVYTADLTAWCNINFASSFSNPLYFANKFCIRKKIINNLVIPESVTHIKPYAFNGCRTITSVTLPNTLTSIGELAFFDCPNLMSVDISNSVKTIDYSAFKFCQNLSTVTLYRKDTYIEDDAFSFCSGTLHVIKGTRDQYQKDMQWENFFIVEDVPDICATPVIRYTDGKLYIESSTPGAVCYYTEVQGSVDNDQLINDIQITAYAVAEGYQTSETITVSLMELLTK